MRFALDDLDVFFPYDKLYPEQFSYMCELKKALDAEGHALLEMPTGTGKTACLLALITAFQYAHPEMGKLIYCTRTVPEMEKCLDELKRLRKYVLEQRPEKSPFLALCLSSRKNMCVHQRVQTTADRENVDVECRKMTASWVRAKAESDPSVETCGFYESFNSAGTDAAMPDGVYDVEDLRALGRKTGWCPYFVARHAITHANVVVYNYQYMLDPKVANLVTRELEKESVVVFDEGHNIDNICIEALSVELHRNRLDAAQRCVARLSKRVDVLRDSNAERVREEFDRLVQELDAVPAGPATDNVVGGGALPAAQALYDKESVPREIQKAHDFLKLLNVFTRHLRRRLDAEAVVADPPQAFLLGLKDRTGLEPKPLKFFHTRLHELLKTLQIPHLEDVQALAAVANFAQIVATYDEGFSVVVDPLCRGPAGIPEPRLDLACLDASLALKPVVERFRSVVITSGTLSPLDLYPKLLNFSPAVRASFPMSIFRPCVLPLVVSRGDDQQPLSTRFESRDDQSVIRNYGALLADVCACVPDGVVAFFTSYSYMERVVAAWDEIGVLRQVLEHKLLFIETKDVVETTLALENFRRACDAGRGAVFLSIARGKVAEGIDFDRHYGRCVVNIGVPFQYTQGHVLRQRLKYLLEKFNIRESDFLTFDALRQSSQCIGRVIRSKTDYGVVLLADLRFGRRDKRSKLPGWVRQFLGDAHLDLASNSALGVVRQFLKQMAQPVDLRDMDQMLIDDAKLAVLLKERSLEAR